jgi:hypothetical protein
MADNNKNIDSKSSIDSIKAFSSVLKNFIKTQGDYDNLVTDSLSSLKNLSRELQKQAEYIEDVASGELKRDKILEKMQKAKQKERIAQRELNNLYKTLNDQQIANATNLIKNIDKRKQLELEYIFLQRSGNQDAADAARIEQMYLDDIIEQQEQTLTASELEYAAALKVLQARSDSVTELSKQEGIIGKIERKLAFIGKISDFTKKNFSSFKGFTNLVGQIPIIGGVLSGLLTGAKALFDFILEIEDRTVKFGRALGYSRLESFKIAENFGSLSTSTGNLLVTTQNLMEVQTDLSNQLGVTNILSNEMLTTQIELKKIMGLSADEMGSLAQASIISGKSQKSTVEGIAGQVAGLKQATGISFNYKQIIGEVTKLSGVLGLKFAKYPESLTKSAIVTKALGMDLAKVDQIAGSLLNFEESIQNQLEAQLITNKDINLSRAQQLALEGDTAGVAMEISKQFGTANEFLEMNRIQQESIAKAVGMSREDLADTLKNQEMLTKLGAKDTDNAQKRLQLALQKYHTETEINKALGEGAYQNLTALSAQEKIAALIDKVKGAFQDFLTKSGVVEWVTGLIHKLTSPDNVKGLINILKDGVAAIADIIQSIAYGILTLANAITFGSNDTIKSMRQKIGEESMGDKIRSLGTGEASVKDFVIKPLGEDTITMAGGTKLGRTDEMVDLLKQILNETKQGKSVTVSVDGQPLATAVARNASLTPAASNLGPRPLR